MLDTNILVSAALFPQSVSAAAYMRAVLPPYKCLVCVHVLEELRRVFAQKFPHRMEALEYFISAMASSVEVVAVPPEEARAESESLIRDIKDRPILRAALAAQAEILISGDKDFLEAPLERPKVLSAAAFLRS
jgi:putative PIN family toxin of toxin-antitoxin system